MLVVLLVLVIAALGGLALYSQHRAEVAEAKVKDAKRLLVRADKLLAEGQQILRRVTVERGKAEVQRDADLRIVDRLRVAKPTLEAVRRAWGITGRLDCAVVPPGSSRVASETFLAR